MLWKSICCMFKGLIFIKKYFNEVLYSGSMDENIFIFSLLVVELF